MAEKISVEELYRRMQDPTVPESTFAEYFMVDPERSGPFRPFVTFDPSKVTVGTTAEARARSELALPGLNALARARRRAAFDLKLLFGYEGPILVSEGDSWFQFPLLLADVIDVLSDTYAISSLDAAGDTLEQMLDQDEYIGELDRVSATILLFSGGGNDVLGGGDLKTHLRPFDPALTPAQYILPSFTALLDRAIGQYDRIFRKLAREAPGVQAICHSYDNAIPAKGRWLGVPMAERGITEPGLQRQIIAQLVSRFVDAMKLLIARYEHVHFLDLRGTVDADEWYDELHPDDAGYAKVAARFAKEIERLVAAPKRRERGRPAAGSKERGKADAVLRRPRRIQPVVGVTGNKGLSLHVGLNKVDADHYGSKCELFGCHNDAKAMAAIAAENGYRNSDVLLDDQATSGAVREHVAKAADALKAGDMFLFTYAGHGAFVPDFSGDEHDDGCDETLCLFDRQLLDDELYELWSKFREGVRVLVVSDSCHSASVIRATPGGLVAVDAGVQAMLPTRPRALSRERRSAVVVQHRAFYRDIAARTATVLAGNVERWLVARDIDSPLACTVRLLSGCQDYQTSSDGDLNGLFTSRMLQVMENGFTGDYAAFHAAIAALMPDSQTPNHWVIGRRDPAFDSQRPFEI